jgi:phenylpropionate dioxygenase-like ring-hydroxylating dioxygenase large terminal subunit
MSAWIDVAAASDVGTRPHAVSVSGRPAVVVRFTPDGPVRAFADHCPHRLVPLAAATTVDGEGDGGVLRCAYHGWEFDADGVCVALPSAGPDATIPPRARLASLDVREADGRVYLRPDAAQVPAGPILTNVDPALAHGWHPVALATEVGPDPVDVTLLGDVWSLRRDGSGTVVTPDGAYATAERWGLVWLAPAEPLTGLFDDPDGDDTAYVGAWLPPSRTNVSAGTVADNFLDVAHFPFVHAGTFGAGEATEVEPYDVTAEPYGCRSVQVQWFDNPGDPGVRAGIRPERQRRRATYVHRAPFQLMLRLEELDAGAVKTILFFAQPETLTRTRIYTKMLLHGIGGVADPGPDTVAAEVAFEEAVLAEDLALQATMTLPGLPLEMRTELHVRADRLGVVLRRTLSRFVAEAARSRR